MTEATLCLMHLPHHPETDQVIQLARNAITQLERQNPLSALHRSGYRAASSAAQASHTPGGGANCQPPDINKHLNPLVKRSKKSLVLNGHKEGVAKFMVVPYYAYLLLNYVTQFFFKLFR